MECRGRVSEKEGKFGLEVITRNQDEALKMVAQHLGMLKNRTELTGADGGPINQVNYTGRLRKGASCVRRTAP